MNTKIIFIILVAIFFLHFAFRIYTNWNNYTTKYDADYWKKRYYASQWVDFRTKTPIGDDGLYAYEGWEYVHGANPVLWNVEVPFLGKYLLGGTILLFQNHYIFGLITACTALIGYYVLNLIVFKKHFVAFIPVLLFSFEPLFYEQMQSSFFDLLQLTFLLPVFIFALKKKYFVSSFFLGCFATIKFSMLAMFPIATILLWLFQTKKHDIYRYIVSLSMVAVVYVSTYAWYFTLGHSFIDFLKVQKYILHFYSIGAKVPIPGTFLPMFLVGVWLSHFGLIQRVHEWHIGWPLLFVLVYYLVWKKLHSVPGEVLLLFLWVIIYSIFLFTTPVFPRYLLLVLPFLYNLAIWGILEVSRVPRVAQVSRASNDKKKK